MKKVIICHLFTHPATPKINGFDPQDFADWLRLHAALTHFSSLSFFTLFFSWFVTPTGGL